MIVTARLVRPDSDMLRVAGTVKSVPSVAVPPATALTVRGKALAGAAETIIGTLNTLLPPPSLVLELDSAKPTVPAAVAPPRVTVRVVVVPPESATTSHPNGVTVLKSSARTAFLLALLAMLDVTVSVALSVPVGSVHKCFSVLIPDSAMVSSLPPETDRV